jgi:hypothetical protein
VEISNGGVYRWSINLFTNPYPIYNHINFDILVSEIIGLETALDLDHYIATLWKWNTHVHPQILLKSVHVCMCTDIHKSLNTISINFISTQLISLGLLKVSSFSVSCESFLFPILHVSLLQLCLMNQSSRACWSNHVGKWHMFLIMKYKDTTTEDNPNNKAFSNNFATNRCYLH